MKIMIPILFLFSLVLFKAEAKSGQPNAEGSHLHSVKQKELSNLYELAKKADKKNLPIMLTFVAEWCEFCHILGSEVLDPMALGKLYEGKYMYMRYVSIDDHEPIPGIDNKPINKDKWSDKYDAELTPTTIFIDSKGNQVGPAIVGIASIELYTMLIHKSLNIAYKKMNNPMSIPPFPEGLIRITKGGDISIY